MSEQVTDRTTTGWLDIGRVLWMAKWLVMTLTAIGFMSGLTYSLMATKWYRADVLLVPSTSDSTGTLSGNLSALGGLVGLAGLGGSKGSTTEAIALLGSGDFIGEFLTAKGLLPVLFEDRWDGTSGGWDSNDASRIPDVQDGVKFMKESILIVSQDPQTGLVRLSIEWKNAATAAEWANAIVSRLNNHMRKHALDAAESNIAYLESQLRDSSVAPLRASIASLLENEHEKVMLARGNSEFAFRVIDSAKAPKQPERPKLVATVFISTVLSFVIAALVVLSRAAIRNQKML